MDNFLMNPRQKRTITSLELLEQINFFRKQEGKKSELQHYDLLKIIRNEFEEEINAGKLSVVTYEDKKSELRPMYVLTFSQARQILNRESKFVRTATEKYIEALEEQISLDQERKITTQDKRITAIESQFSQFLEVFEEVKELRKALQYSETEKVEDLKKEIKLLKKENEILNRENKLLKNSESFLRNPLTEPKPVKRAIATKRGLIFMITRLEPGFKETEEGYNELYKAFEKKYKINLTDEMLKVGRTRKTHFIEKDLKMVDELLELAIELFPTGYKKVKAQYGQAIKDLD